MVKFSEMSAEEQDDYMDSKVSGMADLLERMTEALESIADWTKNNVSSSPEDLRFAIYEMESKAMPGLPVTRRVAAAEVAYQYVQNGTVPDASSGSD